MYHGLDCIPCCYQANGFYGGKGVAGHVPMMYIHFADNFLKAVDHHGYQDRIKYLEYYREGWTFHGKGLWYYHNGEAWPSLTLMGSTNYGNVHFHSHIVLVLLQLSQFQVIGHSLVIWRYKLPWQHQTRS